MIQLANVSKVVTSGSEQLTILHSFDLSVPRGQFISVIGPSGSGKSTLLGLIAGLDAPTSGSVYLDGHDITKMREDQLAELRGRLVGFIFQAFHLIPALTAYENILAPMEIMGISKARERAQALLDEVGLHDRGHHYPSQLSGGEQQRVAIARAFANEPEILLADEPTGNLDTKNGAHIFDLLLNLNRIYGTTLLLVTHDQRLADMADRKITLSGGRIAEDLLLRDGATGGNSDGATGRQGDGAAGRKSDVTPVGRHMGEADGELQSRPVAPSPCRPGAVSPRRPVSPSLPLSGRDSR
jgi:putative ABC transport system ATP-binding protein